MSEPETPATPARSLGGRFREPTHPVLERTNRSVEVDKRLWAEDIAGSRAHAEMLGRARLISDDDVVALLGGLAVVEAELARGAFQFLPSDEDIHMAVERRLGEIAGEPARRLHTGRSRNDQVMTDTLLWLRSAVGRVVSGLVTLIDGLTRRADEAADAPMPSFTHSQPAQVASAGAWLLAHAVEVDRNLRRAADLQDRLDWCPLGSGASAGTYLPTEREQLARSLGFAEPALSGIHATGSRSDLLDAVALCGMIGVMLSRLGEELVLYASPAYGFVELPDGLTTGSSLLPHKRNPDGAELLRGGGRLLATEFGALASFCGGLVSGYSKDLQHDKEVLFRAMDRTIDLLDLAAPHVEQLTLRLDRLRGACGPELAALWLADLLVLVGLPFREAHHRVGAAVRRAQEEGLSLADGLRATPGEEHAAVAVELEALTPELLLTGLRSPGSARPDHVRAAAARLRARWIAAG